MLEKSERPGALVAAANQDGSRSADLDAAARLRLAWRWLEGRMRVALVWLWGGCRVALGWPWGGLGAALEWPWGGLGVALGWLCTPESMPSICLLYGLGVA